MSKVLALGGLIAAYVGFMVIFRYGMPFRVDTGGHVGLSAGIDPDEAALDSRYRRWGWIGFGLVTVGTALQVAALC